MILDLGAALGKLVLAALPSVIGLQSGLQNLVAVSADKASAFRSVSADVGNWRLQAVANLELPARSGTLLLLGSSSLRMPRCVKLNNYWCIKRAGWRGELGADAEGHVAFDTADAGARAAARLLRRYYLEFGRRNALAIVSRWAPNRCLGASTIVARGGTLPAVASLTSWQRLSKEQRDRTFDRLIAERRRIAEARYKMTVQAIASAKRTASLPRPKPKPKPKPQPQPPAAIAVKPTPAPQLPKAASPKRVATIVPISCALEAARISAYARRAIVGIAATPTEDLLLFDERGAATWRLARLMTNMAGVEIGPLKIGESLIPPALAALTAADDPSATGTSKDRTVPETRRPTSSSAAASQSPPS